ncbi:Penicillin binding protein transpeptidase domain protein [compost metagenome]
MHLRHRALFVGFAPAEDPVIAIAIAVEGGGYGGSAAAPIARKVFDAWLLGVMPEGLQPLDAERGTVVVGVATFDAEDPTAQPRAEQTVLALGDLPIMVGAPLPAPEPPPGAPVQPSVTPAAPQSAPRTAAHPGTPPETQR